MNRMRRIDWVLPDLQRDQYLAVLQRNDLRAGTDLVARLILQASLAWLIVAAMSTIGLIGGLVAAALYGHVLSFWGWAGIGHELYHGSVFSNRRLNRRLFEFASILTWNNFIFFESTHSEHHRYTLYPIDPEAKTDARIPIHRLVPLVTIDLSRMINRVILVARNAVNNFPHRAELVFANSPESRPQAVRAARKIVGFQMSLLLVLLILDVDWRAAAMVFSGPFTCQIFNQALQVVQHKGGESGTNDFRKNSRTVLLGPLTSFLYANMNYHVEHHMYPGVPYYNLPRLRKLISESNFELPQVSRGLWRVLLLSFDGRPVLKKLDT